MANDATFMINDEFMEYHPETPFLTSTTVFLPDGGATISIFATRPPTSAEEDELVRKLQEWWNTQ